MKIKPQGIPSPLHCDPRGFSFFLGRTNIMRIVMRIGIPRNQDARRARRAGAGCCGDLVRRGHEVWLEKDAGVKSGFKSIRTSPRWA
jgi:hypothetical protein